MMLVSTPLCQRLAKAKVTRDKAREVPGEGDLGECQRALDDAAEALADELIAQGAADMEGD